MSNTLNREKVISRIHETLKNAGLTLEDLKVKSSTAPSSDAWKEIFKPMSDPVWSDVHFDVLVEDLLIEKGVHVFAGLFESYKTMAALALMSAIRKQDERAFGHFKVNGKGCEVIWLNYDMPAPLLLKYAAYFGLDKDPGFLPNKPKMDLFLAADDPILQSAVTGRVLVIDTMLDIAQIQQAFQSGEWTVFFRKLRLLIDVHGCRAIVLIAHPTKAGAKNVVIDPAEFLKDSVTFGGKIDVGFAFKRTEADYKIFVQRIKGRGWERPITFTLDTRCISGGEFRVLDAPGNAGSYSNHTPNKGGRPKHEYSDIELDRVGTILSNGGDINNRSLAKALGLPQNSHQRARKMRNAWEEREMSRGEQFRIPLDNNVPHY